MSRGEAGAGQEGRPGFEHDHLAALGGDILTARQQRQLFGQGAGQFHPRRATAANDHGEEAALFGGIGDSGGLCDRRVHGRPHHARLVDRPQQQRALQHARDGKVIWPAAQGQDEAGVG